MRGTRRCPEFGGDGRPIRPTQAKAENLQVRCKKRQKERLCPRALLASFIQQDECVGGILRGIFQRIGARYLMPRHANGAQTRPLTPGPSGAFAYGVVCDR